MATDSKTRTNKQSTISFTLPLSCQICLGKVKQPVLCPNHHVFCQLCMDIWLEKNKQCPTCRVDINDENPVRTVIGGQLEEEDKSRQSTAEIRRIRFELLYREYEDQFEQMKKELIILRTENNILAAQLKDAEEENEGHKKAEDKQQQSSSSAKDGPNLLLLTQNLQEAQKLYTGIKGEMTSLKEENGKLKDENINLTRENETLRLEIAQRSPKKFGRYTVATLEAKVSDLEKENRQLKNALQRSDTYIEDLEKQISKTSNVSDGNHPSETSTSGTSIKPSDRTPATAKYVGFNECGSNQKDVFPSGSSSVKRALFNKSLIPVSVSKPSKDQSSPESGADQPYSSLQHDHLENGDLMNAEQDAPSSTNVISQRQPESIMKNTTANSVSKSGKGGRDQQSSERGSKKVKFDIQGDDNVSSSFDLEMPSPYYGVSRKPDSPNSSQEGGGKSISNEVTTTVSVELNKTKSDGPKSSSSAFDEYITDLLEKSNAASYHRVIPNDSLKPDNESKHTSRYNTVLNEESRDVGDGSYLSVPDLNSPNKVTDSSDNEHYVTNNHIRKKNETSDLNISMTPELSDCLQLMTQAERKLEKTPADRHFFPERDGNALKHAQQDLSQLSLSNQAHNQISSLPQSSHSSLNPKSTPFSSYISATDISWKQKFYSTLSTNPYKFNPSVASLSRSQPPPSVNGNVNNSDRVKSLASSESALTTKSNQISEDSLFRETVISSARPSSRGSSMHELDSKFLSISQPSSNLFRPPSSSTTSSSNALSAAALTTNLTGDGASSIKLKSYSLHADPLWSALSHDQSLFSFPSADVNCPVRPQPPPLAPPSQPSSSASSLPFSSLYNLAPTSSNALSSTSSLHSHIESVHSRSLHPTSSLAFSNPLPPSLNNSALEWPEDPSDLSMSQTNGVGSHPVDRLTSDSPDMLPLPSRDMAGHRSGSFFLKSGRHQANSSYISSSLVSDESSFQLPEPKKRLFNSSDDDLELPSSPFKTTKR